MSARSWRVMQLGAEHYGFYQHIVPLALACHRAGFEVICTGPAGTFDGKLHEQELRFIPLPFRRRGFKVTAHALCLWRLVYLLRSERIDILHSHTTLGGLLGRLAARLARVPVSVYTAHGFHFHERMSRPSFTFFWTLEWLAAQQADFLFTQNENDRRAAILGRFGSPDRIAVVGNGVNLGRFDREAIVPSRVAARRTELGIPPDVPVVTLIARPTRNKGVRDFFHIARRVVDEHPTAWFLAVLPPMPGEPRGIRHELERASLPPRTLMVGYRQDVPELLALSSIYLLPSQYEGLNKTVIEAMAMSLPVVGYDVRGIRELVRHGETGMLVALDDWEGASRAVLNLLDDPGRSRAMGARAREHALIEHDESLVFARQIEVIRRLIEEKGRR